MKILHIGNIANNAYWNAKILNDAGHDNTVLCKDYYHVMGCPEWEEVYLDKMPSDHFNPAWYEVVQESYSRPDWFLQGQEATCLEFLSVNMQSESLARKLAIESRTVPLWALDLRLLLPAIGIQLAIIYRKILDFIYLLPSYSKIYRFLKRHPRTFRFLRGIKRVFVNPMLSLEWTRYKYFRFMRGERNGIWRLRRQEDFIDRGKSFELRVAELCEKYRTEFPDSIPLTPDDFAGFETNFYLWSQIFKKYDFVIGYALDGIRPLLSGVPYAAFEHGTIREIPYEESARGRLCRLTYRMADHCFVTNLDCVESAEYLAPGKFSTINHPFDEAIAGCFPGQSALRERLLRSLDASFLIFHPTRQDWKVGTGPADKANDNFWRAVGLLRNDGVKVGVICTKWGRNISESMALVRQLGIRANVEWIDPQATLPFLAMCVAVDLVADQFHLGAFGGILPKALACGTPVLTYLEEEKARTVFPESPPVLNCRTSEEIASQVRMAVEHEDVIEKLSVQGKCWVAEHHSKNLIEREFDKVLSTVPKRGV